MNITKVYAIKKVNIQVSNYNIYGRLLFRFKKGCNLFYKTLIYGKNHSNWEYAKKSIEILISRKVNQDYAISQDNWNQTVKSTFKIKNHNNLKEFQILLIRNNLFFNDRLAKIYKNQSNLCNWCLVKKATSYHNLISCMCIWLIWEKY